MFHFFTLGVGFFADDLHAWRGPNTTFTIDDFVGPYSGPEAKAAGLPYLKGGICETGGSLLLLQEAQLYAAAPNSWGVAHKNLMRASPFRRHVTGMSMVGEDMPQEANRVDLDPKIRDVYGFPVPRITRSQHNFELAASAYYGPKLAAICAAAPGALSGQTVPDGTLSSLGGPASGLAGGGLAATAHIMGTARMGADPRRSVTDAFGRTHEIENLFIADGSVFVSSGGFNPTNTIMSLSLRMARHIAGVRQHQHQHRHQDRRPSRRASDRS
jgi:choline dehydrogenase-like flavoprotein